jgi:peptidoglycan/LPS O-acetylase OafA/YrhL
MLERPFQTRVDENPLGAGRIPSIDGLRALAVGLVLLAHACQTRGFPGGATLQRAAKQGAIGVEVFFVISGFLITTLMLREVERTGGVSIAAFYARRALRIMPAYLAYMSTIAVLNAAGYLEIEGRDWVAAATYTVNFLHRPTWEVGHVWSLSIEEHFYLFWPIVVAVGGPRWAWRTGVGMVGGCFLGRWAVMLLLPRYTPMAELWTFTRLDTIACGSLLALLAWDPNWRPKLDRMCSKRSTVLLAVVGLGTSLSLSCVSARFSVGVAYSLNASLICILLWAAVRSPASWAGRLLNHRIAVIFGLGSYSLYLWQQIFLRPGKGGIAYAFPQNLIFACGVAALSWLLIEKPFLLLKSRLQGFGSGRPAGIIGASSGSASPPCVSVINKGTPIGDSQRLG